MGDFLKKVLPWIGAAATGNVPMLIGMAAKEVGGALGVDIEPQAAAIAKAVSGATPEQMAVLQERELTFKERMQAMGFKHVEEMARVGLEETKALIGDTQHAREKHASNRGVYWLGIAVLVTFAGVMGFSLWGAFAILTGGITIKDIGVVAAVFGFLGTVVGYVAANAQQVIAYFFGSSRGSKEKSDAMAETFKQLGGARGP